MKTLDISVPDGGGAGGHTLPLGSISNSLGGKALMSEEEPERGDPHEPSTPKKKTHTPDGF